MTTYDHICPDCGGQMVLRTNSKTREQFWGCCNFPNCTGTRPRGGENPEERGSEREAPSERAYRNDKNRWRNEG